MTATAGIVAIGIAIVCCAFAAFLCYKLDKCLQTIDYLRGDNGDLRGALQFTREMRDVYAKSLNELERENEKLRRAIIMIEEEAVHDG